jgi:hypothetical protein
MRASAYTGCTNRILHVPLYAVGYRQRAVHTFWSYDWHSSAAHAAAGIGRLACCCAAVLSSWSSAYMPYCDRGLAGCGIPSVHLIQLEL